MITIHRGIRNEYSTYDNDRRFIQGQRSCMFISQNRYRAVRLYAMHNTHIRVWTRPATSERCT